MSTITTHILDTSIGRPDAMRPTISAVAAGESPVGTIVTALAFVVLAVAGSRWEIYLASALLGIGVGFAFASLANLIVEAVPAEF